MNNPGKIVLLGSGETAPVGGRVLERLAQGLPTAPVISILETPAGFELNSQKVAGRVGAFLQTRLQNYHPEIHIVPARKRGTEFSPDNPDVLQPLLTSDVIFMGAGSPTYAIRQLQGSLAWDVVRLRHARGAALVLASAAIIAAGRHALPVYEIFKVGQDPHWVRGLDFLAAYGLSLSFVPHWNNQEGGADLDTGRCFVGQERFDPLLAQLGPDDLVVGVDEMTALSIDFERGNCEVSGQGSLHLVRQSWEEVLAAGSTFPLSRLGDYQAAEDGLRDPKEEARRMVESAARAKSEVREKSAPEEVVRLAAERQKAREGKDWERADAMRREIEKSGWQVNDTPAGPRLEALNPGF